MANHFKSVGLMGKPRHHATTETSRLLHRFLTERGLRVLVEEQLARELNASDMETASRDMIGGQCDLVLVVGGDGSMLNAARAVASYGIPVLGINRGHLGFLTDISPTELKEKLVPILEGDYIEERRFLLQAVVLRHEDPIGWGEALNDVVLYAGEIARMIEFEVYVNDQFVYSQRSDGLIVSTPTGSTAYALSGGGPILHPSLQAIVLVPMFPHTLSARPIVVDAASKIEIVIAASNQLRPQVSCDGQVHIAVAPGDTLTIKRKEEDLRLIHPRTHNYYHTLRTKLGWGSKL